MKLTLTRKWFTPICTIGMLDIDGHPEWRDVIGYEGTYEVSRSGFVRRCQSGNILAAALVHGYKTAHLCQNGKRKLHYVHRLVAKAWIPNPTNEYTVNHKNGDKLDNNVENLEWMSLRANVLHAYETGLSDSTGEANPRAKLTHENVSNIKQKLLDGRNAVEIAKEHKVGPTCIRRIALGIRWSHIK